MSWLDELRARQSRRSDRSSGRLELRQGQEQALGYLDEGYNAENALQRPVADLFSPNVANMQAMAGQTSPAQQYVAQLEQMRAPMLTSEDYANDPIYQAQVAELQRVMARSAASGGGLNSSDFQNALIRNSAPLMQGVYDRSLTAYGLDANRYGNLYDMSNQLNEQQYGRYGDLSGIGVGGINALTQGNRLYGSGRSNIAMDTANALAGTRQSNLDRRQRDRRTGSGFMNTVNDVGAVAGAVSGLI